MIFRQLFDADTSTYSYLVAHKDSRAALLIDPVKTQIELYAQLLDELSLVLEVAIDTHVHADHVTALGALRQRYGCQTYLGRKGAVACSDHSLTDGLVIELGALQFKALYTPGHTDDSHCFLLTAECSGAPADILFSGDTLLIRGTGRTDFQNGSAQDLYQSLHDVLLKLDDNTLVYPGHDYRGMTMSTIGEERLYNPRLQWHAQEFVKKMAELNLPKPKYIDEAVPANLACGNAH